MKPAGIIITYIDWRKWKQWFFNIPLFLFQLTFMVVGKILGKVEVEWGEIWHAAQASHIRLVLNKLPIGWQKAKEPPPGLRNFHLIPIECVKNDDNWMVANFGYPEMEVQLWREAWNAGERFEYRDPKFTFSQDRIDGMIQYAHDQVGKRYDPLQLLSPPANFPIWIIYPPQWGKEIIRWFNLPGAREYCSSGAVATLLWFAEATQVRNDMRVLDGNKSEFFGTYDSAMVMPCMFVISDKWRKVK